MSGGLMDNRKNIDDFIKFAKEELSFLMKKIIY